MADETPNDVAEMYSRNGELYAFIDGQMFKLQPTAEAIEVLRAKHEKKYPPKRQAIARPAAPPPDAPAKTMARQLAEQALEELDGARKRFAAQGTIRQSFDVPPGAQPGSPEYENGLSRYLDQLAKHP